MTVAPANPSEGTYGRSRVRVGDPLPAVLVLADIAALLGLTSSTVWSLYRQGELKRFALDPIGKRPRFSGKKVQAWLDGEHADDESSDETAPGRRYFKSARRLRMAKAAK